MNHSHETEPAGATDASAGTGPVHVSQPVDPPAVSPARRGTGLTPGRLRLAFFVAVGFLVLTGVLVPAIHHALNRAPSTPLPELGRLPDFALPESGGGTLSLADLRGRIWVADFIFTHCPNACIRMSTQMQRLQRSLAYLPETMRDRVRLVSFSVDPERDTPERLADYGRTYRADPERWLFVTGAKDAILALLQDGFRLPGPVPAAKTPAGTILHSSKFVLVDGDGVIRGYYEGIENDALDALLTDIRRLLEGG